jgi:hypothetical protein
MGHPPFKTTLDVLVSEEDLQKHFSATIADVISGNRELKLRVHTSTHALQIMTLAGKIELDLLILFLNNIAFPTGNMPPVKRLSQALKLVTRLKTGTKSLSSPFTDGRKRRLMEGVQKWRGRISCQLSTEALSAKSGDRGLS